MTEHSFNEHLGYNIHIVSHFLQNSYNEKLGEYGLTHSQAKVIYYLATSGEQSQTDLQNKLHIKASSMNGIIDSLLKHGRIHKQSCLHDKRSKMITLTDEGKNLHNQVITIIESIESDLSVGLSEQEKNKVVSCLKKMQGNMKP